MLVAGIVIVVLIVVVAVLMVLTNKRLADRSPKFAPAKTGRSVVVKGMTFPIPPEMRLVRMYDDETKKYHGKGVRCTYEEFMVYQARWYEADNIVEKFGYVESSHIIGQRPVWVK